MLMYAVKQNDVQLMQQLVEAGAAANAVVHDWARDNMSAELVKRAVKLDPSLAFYRDGEGRTVLQVAAKECKVAIQSVIFFLVPPTALPLSPPPSA